MVKTNLKFLKLLTIQICWYQLQEAFEDYELEDGTTTTAVPRPNAYIPDEGKLPLPKPYGALAPFKPSENGSSMRHIRKPVLKPIEI